MARKLAFDPLLFGVVLSLTLLGLVMVYSSTSVHSSGGLTGNPLFVRQCVAALLGLGAMAIA
ncbi:MAG: stage V sporulation protein E, partial [Acidobacteriota bacterium]